MDSRDTNMVKNNNQISNENTLGKLFQIGWPRDTDMERSAALPNTA